MFVMNAFSGIANNPTTSSLVEKGLTICKISNLFFNQTIDYMVNTGIYISVFVRAHNLSSGPV
jgi:hypothetical protein